MISSRTYLDVLRRWWWVPLVVLVATVAAALFLTWRTEPIYRSSVSLVVVPNEVVQDAGDFIDSLDTLDRRSVIATIAEVPETREAELEVQERLDLSSSERRDYDVHASVRTNTNVLRIEVEGPEPEGAAAFANALAGVTAEAGERLYRIYDIQVLEKATPRSRPVHPDPRRNLTVAIILGLLGGAVAAFLLDVLVPRPS